jgi:hypothetical protein
VFSACRLVRGLVLAALLGLPVLPQSSTGSVRGTVYDQTQAVIPGAAVTLVNTATNVELKTSANEVSIYLCPAVVPGACKLTVDSPGMRRFEGALTVQVQQSVAIDVTLQPAGTQTLVSVEDVTPMVTSDNPTLGHTLERQRIEQLPINGRSVMNLLWTVPGLTNDSDGNWRTYGTRVGTHDVSLDGAALTDAVYGGGSVARPPNLACPPSLPARTAPAPSRWTTRAASPSAATASRPPASTPTSPAPGCTTGT